MGSKSRPSLIKKLRTLNIPINHYWPLEETLEILVAEEFLGGHWIIMGSKSSTFILRGKGPLFFTESFKEPLTGYWVSR